MYRRGRSYNGEPTHLGDIYDRRQNTEEQSWTFSYLLGKIFRGKPVYALTSWRTFAAADAHDGSFLGTFCQLHWPRIGQSTARRE